MRSSSELAAEPALTLLCGRYEGFDERIVEHFASDVISIGRYVLAGGELAAMVVCDAVLRKQPGALGHEESARRGVLQRRARAALPEYPHYTRPAEFRGWPVPEVLLSGHHEEIRRWRLEQARGATAPERRAVRCHGRATRSSASDSSARRRRTSVRLPFAMSTVIDNIERAQLRRVPQFHAGDRLRVHFLVIEGTRRRTQVFEGVVIKRQGHGARETFTVRKQSFGVGVERTFPLHSPKIEKIEVAARGDVRRAKLYYLRDRVGKRARVRERGYVGPRGGRSSAGLLYGRGAAARRPRGDRGRGRGRVEARTPRSSSRGRRRARGARGRSRRAADASAASPRRTRWPRRC